MRFWSRREPQEEIGPASRQYMLAAKALGIDIPQDKPVSFFHTAALVAAMARRIRALEEKKSV